MMKCLIYCGFDDRPTSLFIKQITWMFFSKAFEWLVECDCAFMCHFHRYVSQERAAAHAVILSGWSAFIFLSSVIHSNCLLDLQLATARNPSDSDKRHQAVKNSQSNLNQLHVLVIHRKTQITAEKRKSFWKHGIRAGFILTANMTESQHPT